MKSEIRNVLVWCLLGLAASTNLYGQTGNYEISRIDDFPKVVLDTSDYSFGFHLINTDPTDYLDGIFSFYISINGDQATKLVADINVSIPVAPGDSVEVAVQDYSFDFARFGGGGVTHDIIVWPMRIGSLPPNDSIPKSVFAISASDPGSEELGIEVGNFPPRIRDGEDYDLSFEIINNDIEKLLYQPLDIYMKIDGGPARVIASGILPDLPVQNGDSYTVNLPDYIFNSLDFASVAGGGNVTHDIIVWPMKVGLINGDSAHLQADYFRTAAYSLEEGVAGLPPVLDPYDPYNIYVAAKNIGATPNNHPTDFYVQLDDHPPVLYYQSSLYVAPDHYVSTISANFEVAAYFGYGPNDSSFFNQAHELKFWAVERNGISWHIPAVYTVVNPTDNPSPESLAAETGGAVAGGGSGNDGQIPQFNLADTEHGEYGGLVIELVQAGLSPNPFKDELHIQYSEPIVGQVELRLYTMHYFQVLDKRWTLPSATSRLTFDTSALRSGLYMYHLEVGGKVYTGKVLKE
ncbi:MAG: T9SS type A sorting domain-containing protein [Bacteroidota bacterium]